MWNKKIKIISKIIKVLAIAVIVFVAGLVLLTTIPEFQGYKTLIVTSGSMEPALPVGSMIFVKITEDVNKTDIITYKLRSDQKTLVTHRVVDIIPVEGKNFYQVKGDAVEKPDVELINKNQVVGKLFFMIPFLGIPIAFAKTQLGVIALVVIPASIIVYEEFRKILEEIKKLRTKVDILEKEEEKIEEVLEQKIKTKKKKSK